MKRDVHTGTGHAPDSEDAKRPFVEVSGRKGLGVKADDLLDIVIRKAADEVSKRNTELSPSDVQETASAIGIAAVRYFLVKFSRGKVIAFDLEEADGGVGTCCGLTLVAPRGFAGPPRRDRRALCLSALLEVEMEAGTCGCCCCCCGCCSSLEVIMGVAGVELR